MQSSFNVIKNSRVVTQGSAEINTQLGEKSADTMELENDGIKSNRIKSEDIKSYENIAKNILDNARRQSEEIISKAYIAAQISRTKAFEEGHKEGHKEGFESGYSEAMQKAMAEVQVMKTNSDNLLYSAKQSYDEYLVDKEQRIKDLVINIAESILKSEVKQPGALNEMVFSTLKDERSTKVYIIKVNNSHFAALRDEVENFKDKLAFQGDIFVVEDNSLDEGTAIIEKESGKSIVSIAYGIEKIVEIFRQEQILI